MGRLNKKIPRRHGGFTLLEIMVVVGLFALLVSIAIPNMVRFRQSSAAYQCARNLVANLDQARNLSLRTEAEAYIKFESSGQQYEIWYNDGSDKLYKRIYIAKDYGGSISLDLSGTTEIRFASQGFVKSVTGDKTLKVKSGALEYDVVIEKSGKSYVKPG
ncbi:MAG: type II secretion system protein [Candidatus Eremiobacteraeota bacterium]|nr:type II secretion system protein [Candidatus Eremiobacteraeota bacterium]